MKKTIVACALSITASAALGADWSYRTKHDPLFNKEERTATLIGAGGGHANLMIYSDTKGARFVMLSAQKMKCFPRCVVFAKFDDSPPEAFPASSTQVVAAAVTVDSHDEFVRRVTAAKKVTFRLVRYDALGDIEFDIDAPYNPERFSEARARGTIDKQCKDNAVNEDYSACVARMSTQSQYP